MKIIRNIRTPIMHRAVEANGFVFVGGTTTPRSRWASRPATSSARLPAI